MKIDLKSALARRKMSQQSLADAIDVSKSFMSDLVNGSKQPSIETLGRILNALNADISEIIPSRHLIAVPGYVGAGDQVDMVNPYAVGDGMYHVTCPPQLLPHDVVALEIRGQSMEPTYLDGGLIFYTREALAVPTEAEFRICVAEDEDENIWLKQVKPSNEGRGLYDLISFNPKIPPMYGKALKWASQVRFYLPPDMVERIERD